MPGLHLIPKDFWDKEITLSKALEGYAGLVCPAISPRTNMNIQNQSHKFNITISTFNLSGPLLEKI